MSNLRLLERSVSPEKGLAAMLTFVFFYNMICLISLIQETQTDFNDLGKLLLVGVAAAIVFAVGFTFVRLKLREKSPQTSSFISISSANEKNEKVGD